MGGEDAHEVNEIRSDGNVKKARRRKNRSLSQRRRNLRFYDPTYRVYVWHDGDDGGRNRGTDAGLTLGERWHDKLGQRDPE